MEIQIRTIKELKKMIMKIQIYFLTLRPQGNSSLLILVEYFPLKKSLSRLEYQTFIKIFNSSRDRRNFSCNVPPPPPRSINNKNDFFL